MILLTINMKVTSEIRKELIQTIVTLAEAIRGVSGCISCEIYTSLEDHSQLCLFEEWQFGAFLAGHMRSEIFKVLLGQ